MADLDGVEITCRNRHIANQDSENLSISKAIFNFGEERVCQVCELGV